MLSSKTSRPTQLPEMPVAPEEELEGQANAVGMFTAGSADGEAGAGFWSCDPGRYEFYFGYDEFVYLIEGELTVHEGAESYDLYPGDSAFFPQGCTVIWHVKQRMTKYFVAREPY